MATVISIKNLSKTYASGFRALKNVNLEIKRGEIFALLGPNGAGKTTLISIICGIASATSGSVKVGGFDIEKDYKKTRALIGLVPQEITNNLFEIVWDTVSFTRGLFGKAANPAHIESVLRDLTLWDKKSNRLMTLSGGMKRRVMIAKALSHEPQILFLDEPSAGVDVQLRKEMWEIIRGLRDNGVTIILTTHYIQEAEDMADRIGIIDNGELIVTEDKSKLLSKLGKKRLTLFLREPIEKVPDSLEQYRLVRSDDGLELVYTFEARGERTGITALLQDLSKAGIGYTDLETSQSSLEEIFVSLVKETQ